MAIDFKKYIQNERCLSDLEGLNNELVQMKNQYLEVSYENSRKGILTSELQIEIKKQLDYLRALVGEFNNEMLNGALKSYKFEPKRKKGAIGDKQKHIEELVAAHPELKHKELDKLADKTIIGDMKFSTFSNNVSKARKRLKLFITV